MEDKKTIRGINIYTQKNGQTIYYDRFTKNGYIIKDSVQDKYYFYKNRYLYVAIGAILAANFIADWETVLIFSAVAFVLLELSFRKRFLSKLTTIPKFKPEKRKNLFEKIGESDKKGKLIIKTILYFVLTILLSIYSFTTKLDLIPLILIILFTIVVAVVALSHLIAVIRKK